MSKNLKIELDEFRNHGKENNLWGHFEEQLDELLNTIWPVYRYYINCVLCKSFS